MTTSVLAQVDHTDWGHCYCVCKKFKCNKGDEENCAHVSGGHCCTVGFVSELAMKLSALYFTLRDF